MKFELSSLDVHYLEQELQVVTLGKLDRIYHAKESKNEFLFAFHVTNQGKKFLRIILPSLLFLDEVKESFGEPTGLCMMLRKYLEGSRLKSIRQHEFERIIVMEFDAKIEGKNKTFFVIVELFSKGNIIFCDEKFTILNVLETQHWVDRDVARVQTYKYPKPGINPYTITCKSFEEILENSSRESIVKSLAMDFSLGGKYAEVICVCADIKKTMRPKDADASQLFSALQQVLHMPLSPNVLGDILYAVSLPQSNSVETSRIIAYESLSKAIAVQYGRIAQVSKDSVQEKRAEKIKIIIAEQEKTLQAYEEEYALEQSKGEAIYTNYAQLSSIIETIKTARKKYSWKEIKAKLANDPEFKKLIKDIDEKNQEIVVDLDALSR